MANPPVSITTGSANINNLAPMPVSDSNSLYNNGSSKGIVTDFRVQSYYERDYRRYMMGIASPAGFKNSSAAFIQLASPTLLWIADWTGAEFINAATVPDPTSVSSLWTLLDVFLQPYSVILAPDGSSPLYRLSGTYIFGHQSPGNNFYDNVSYPLAPWVNGNNLIRSITATSLQSLLEPTGIAIKGGGGNLPPGGPVRG